jgi:hypothetical protein
MMRDMMDGVMTWMMGGMGLVGCLPSWSSYSGQRHC